MEGLFCVGGWGRFFFGGDIGVEIGVLFEGVVTVGFVEEVCLEFGFRRMGAIGLGGRVF